MNEREVFKLIGQGIAALILIWILYQLWPFILGGLAICGGHYLLQEWRNQKKR